MKQLKDIRIRDPFIYCDKESETYYMYGTTAPMSDSLGTENLFSVYKSSDLKTFDDGKIIIDERDISTRKNYWASEMHYYNNRYYLLCTIEVDGKGRGTYSYVSDSCDGIFTQSSISSLTPLGWECLDGTLYIQDGAPYLVFCREWLQIGIGAIYAIRLNDTLTHSEGEAKLLFEASESPRVCSFKNDRFDKCMITDGPYIVKDKGKLIMIWSSLCDDCKYSILQATAENLLGQWKQEDELIFSGDGGHGMIFIDFDGNTKIALHQPNTPNLERAKFYQIEFLNNKIRIK
ncbi:MAG: family 43 glycosylhydrolase [Clostridia bacterium]